MNYEQARQKSDGKWHYTNRNDDRIYPIGYCSPQRECPVCHGKGLVTGCESCNGKGFTYVDPCPGHDTAEEAERHYYEWEADHLHNRTYQAVPGVGYICVLCGQRTLRGMHIEGEMRETMLCDEHCNREGWMSANPFKVGRVAMHS